MSLFSLMQFRMPPAKFVLDGLHRLLPCLRAHHIVSLRINRKTQVCLANLPKQRIDLRKALDLIAPELNPVRIVIVRGKKLDYIAAHAKRAAPEVADRFARRGSPPDGRASSLRVIF